MLESWIYKYSMSTSPLFRRISFISWFCSVSFCFPLFWHISPLFKQMDIVCIFIGLFPHNWVHNCIHMTFMLSNWVPSAVKHWLIRVYHLFSHSCHFFPPDIFDRRKGGTFPPRTHTPMAELGPQIKPTTLPRLFSFQVCGHIEILYWLSWVLAHNFVQLTVGVNVLSLSTMVPLRAVMVWSGLMRRGTHHNT